MALGNEVQQLGLYYAVFISPGTLHFFKQTGDEPLGFTCTIDRYRDKQKLSEEEFLTVRIWMKMFAKN